MYPIVVLSQFLQDVEDDLELAGAAARIEDEIRLPQIESTAGPFNDMTLAKAADVYDLGETFIDFGTFNGGIIPGVENSVDYSDDRFSVPISEEDIKNLINSQSNVNTRKNTYWAIGVSNEWRSARGKRGDDINEFDKLESAEMNHWLQHFVLEARNKKGEEYPLNSLYSITCICGLSRYCKDQNVNDKQVSVVLNPPWPLALVSDSKCDAINESVNDNVNENSDGPSQIKRPRLMNSIVRQSLADVTNGNQSC